jgi:hypothetical protein
VVGDPHVVVLLVADPHMVALLDAATFAVLFDTSSAVKLEEDGCRWG